MDLPSLIGSAEWLDFCGSFRGRRTRVLAGRHSSPRFDPLWAAWVVESVGRFTVAPSDHERFRLIKAGKTVAPALYTDRNGIFHNDSFEKLLAGGASLALGDLGHYFNPVLALSRGLEAELRCPVQVNLYITPPGGQGLGSHVDPHDVLILQICGEKTWRIHEGSDPAGASHETTMVAGSWLYLPKGIRHEVRNRGRQTSVHLTLGFHPLTWGEVIERALRRARVDRPELNAPLLPGEAVNSDNGSILARFQSILAFIDPGRDVASYYGGFAALGVQVPSEHVPTNRALEAISGETVLRWRPEAELTVSSATPPMVQLPYRRAPLVFHPRWAELIATLRQPEWFTPTRVGIEPQLAVPFCRFLAGVGALGMT